MFFFITKIGYVQFNWFYFHIVLKKMFLKKYTFNIKQDKAMYSV